MASLSFSQDGEEPQPGREIDQTSRHPHDNPPICWSCSGVNPQACVVVLYPAYQTCGEKVSSAPRMLVYTAVVNT